MSIRTLLRAAARAGALLGLSVSATCTSEYTKDANAGWLAGTAGHTIEVGSDTRTFLLHIPHLRPRNRVGALAGFPVVILLHGSGADGETVRRQSGIEALADSQRFIVAYPNGTTRLLGFGSDWNAGDCCGNASRAHVDDVGFIRAVVADISAHVPVDRRRIFIAGFSDGARMAYRMGCDAAPLVAAIGVVSGSLEREDCAPARPVPLIAFHGTSDPEVPYMDSARTTGRVPPPTSWAQLPPSVQFWSAANGCTAFVQRRFAPHVMRTAFTPCRADVVLYSVEGGLHAWPGGEKDGSDGAQPTTEIGATGTMLQFFLRHPLR